MKKGLFYAILASVLWAIVNPFIKQGLSYDFTPMNFAGLRFTTVGIILFAYTWHKGKVWGNNLVFCALAGVLWYMQFFGLEMGKSFLTENPVLLAFSWCILMALNVTFSNVWGIILKEWKGVSNKTITVLIAGLIVLIFSLVFPNLF